jgi:hypothetical protein
MLDCRGEQLVCCSGRPRVVGWGDRWRRSGSSAPYTDASRLTPITYIHIYVACFSFIIHDITRYIRSLAPIVTLFCNLETPVGSNAMRRMNYFFLSYTATGYGLDGQNSIPRSGRRIFSTSSRPSLGSTQPSIQWVPAAKAS